MNQTIIKIKTIVENNSIDNIIDDVIQPYTLLGVEMNLDKYIKYLKARIKLALKPMMEWELLYDESTATSMLYGYFNDTIGNLLTNSFVEKLMMDESWTTQNLGAQTQTSENNQTINNTQTSENSQTNENTQTNTNNQTSETTQNYQGFDLNNQDGQFNKQSTTTNGNGNTTTNGNTQLRGNTQANGTSKTTNTSTTSGGAIKLQYLQHIQSWTQTYLDNLIRWIKINMCILIY